MVNVNGYASVENAMCPLFFSQHERAPFGEDSLLHKWPRTLLYTFPQIAAISPTPTERALCNPGILILAREALAAREFSICIWPTMAAMQGLAN